MYLSNQVSGLPDSYESLTSAAERTRNEAHRNGAETLGKLGELLIVLDSFRIGQLGRYIMWIFNFINVTRAVLAMIFKATYYPRLLVLSDYRPRKE